MARNCRVLQAPRDVDSEGPRLETLLWLVVFESGGSAWGRQAGRTLEGSFSDVSTPNFASQHSEE